MIANFFQSLTDRGVDYLLISADLQQADRRYWREIIAELKGFRSAGKLVKEGSSV